MEGSVRKLFGGCEIHLRKGQIDFGFGDRVTMLRELNVTAESFGLSAR